MDIPGQNCPSNLALKESASHRLCQKKEDGAGCGSVTIPTGGQSYTKVRGRVTGYGYRSNDAFRRYSSQHSTIDGPYVDGVSITYGSSVRKHVWTYAAGSGLNKCPELGDANTKQPAFVSNKYLCTPAAQLVAKENYFFDAPLWTSLGDCVGDCPDDLHFCVTLDQPTTEDLELRVCTDQSKNDEDVYIKSFDFYIK